MIFIDEISMVGYSLFKKLEQHLCGIMGSSYPFCGSHIVTIGDFYQLAPVEDTPLYKSPRHGYGILALHVFKDFFKIFLLKQIMRKRSKSLLSITKLIMHQKVDTRRQIDIEKREISKNDPRYNPCIRHFPPFILSVHNIMLTFTIIHNQKKTVIDPHDIVMGSPQECDQIKYLTLVQNCDKCDVTKDYYVNYMWLWI